MKCPFAPGQYWHWLSATLELSVSVWRFWPVSKNPAQTDEQCCVVIRSNALKYGCLCCQLSHRFGFLALIWHRNTCLTWKWPGFGFVLLICLPSELLSEGGRAEAREQPGHQPHHTLHMVRLHGKNTCTSRRSFYVKCTAESHYVQIEIVCIQSSLCARSTWLCDGICVVSVTFPSFFTTQLNCRTVSCLFPLCILHTRTGREVYSGLNGLNTKWLSVFLIIFCRFSHFYCWWFPIQHRGTRRSMSAQTPCFPLSLSFYFLFFQ